MSSSTQTKTSVLSTNTAAVVNDEKVIDWRRSQLEKAGYATEAAAKLAARGDVDLHHASTMREQGCTDALALEILF